MPFGNMMGVGNAGRAAMGNVNPNPGMRGRPQFGMAGGPGKQRAPEPPPQMQPQQFGQDYGGGLGPSAGAAAQLAQKMSQPRIRSERDMGMRPPSVGGAQVNPQAPGNEMAPRPMPGMKMGRPWQNIENMATNFPMKGEGGYNPPGGWNQGMGQDQMERNRQNAMRDQMQQMYGQGPQRGLGPRFGDQALQGLQGLYGTTPGMSMRGPQY